MLQNDASQAGSTPDARNDLDQLVQCDLGPATGNAITGAGTVSGAAGADTVANAPAMIVAVNGVESSGGTISVEGQYGSLVMQSDGSYTYTRSANAPDGVSDVFTYTLADAAGARDTATLTVDIRCQQDEAEEAQNLVTAADGVVMLPAGVELSDIRVVGRDLVITLPDGSTVTVPNGAVFVPQIVIGDVEVPPTNLAALLIDAEPQPAAGTPQSSGGNFEVDVPPLDPGVPLGDLLPPTDFGFPQPDFEEVGQFIDEEPEITIQPDGQPASANAVDTVDEAGLPPRGEEPPGSNQAAPSETTSGVIHVDSPDGPSVVTVNGVAVTAVGQVIAGEFGSLTITSISETEIGYTYTLADNTSGDATHDDFSVTVTDSDGDADTATLRINIIDDVPTAVNDTDSIAAGQFGPATGNVLTDADPGDAGDSDNGADTVGADDAELTSVTGAGDTDVNEDGSFVVEGEYGVLTIEADGSYSYVRNPGTPGGVTDTFTYTLTDGDGDTDTATLTIDIGDLTPETDDNPVVLLDDDALAGGNPGGLGDDPDSVNTSGTLVGTGGDGDLTFELQTSGAPDGFTYVEGPDGSVLVQQGGVTVLTITLDAETGDYTVTQNAPIDHAAGGNENNSGFTITYTVTDADGDSATGTLDIDVDDDTPEILRADVNPPVLLVDETDLAVNDSGDFSTLFDVSYGADGAGTTEFELSIAAAGTPSGLTDVATGDPILLFDNNGVIEGRVGGADGPVAFTVSVDSETGVVTLDQLRALDHPNTADPDDTVSPDATSIQLSVTATDADGDPVSETINIGGNLSFDDDGPSLSGVSAGAGVTLDETEAGSPGGFQISATSASAVISATSAFGADGAGSVTYGLSLPGGTDSGLATAIGDFPITLVQVDSDTIQGQYNGTNVAFTIEMNDDGTITVTQEVPLEHLVDGSTPEAHDDALDLAGLVNATVTVTDRDGDSVSGEVAIGDNIVFEDDGPSVNVTADVDGEVVLLTEDAETIGGDSDSASSDIDFSAVFDAVFDGGADGAAGTPDLTYTLGLQTEGGPSGLTQGSAPIFLYLIGGVVVGSTSDSEAGVLPGNTVFEVSVDADGVVTLTQHSQIDHPIADDPSATEAPFADQIASIADELITLTASGTVTDNDGDTATDSAVVNIGANLQFADDGPTITAALTQPVLIVDETDLPIDDSGDFSGVFTGNYGADGPGTTTYTLGVNAGATGIVDTATGEAVVLVMNGDVVEGRTETSNELVFTVSVDADGNVTLDQLRAVVHNDPADHDESGLSAVTLASDELITLTATITDADGDTDSATAGIGQNLQFEDDGPDAAVDGQAAPDTLVLDESRPVGSETDGDSDPAGLMTVTGDFADNFVTPVDFGADGEGSVSYSLVLNGDDVPSGLYALDPSDTTDGDTDGIGQGDEILLNQSGNTITGSVNGVTYFTISINAATGEVTFTQNNNVWHSITGSDDDTATLLAELGSIFVRQTVTDGDGDSDTADIDVSRGVFQIEDDGPTADDEAQQNVAEGDSIGGQFDFTTGTDGGGITHVNGVELVFGMDGFSQTIPVDDGTIRVQADGTYVFTADASGSGVTSGTFTVTDGDGDTETADWSFNITDANAPTANPSTARLDDDGLGGGNPASTEGDLNANFGEVAPVNPSEAIYHGLLSFSFGSDGAGSISFAAMDGTSGSVGTETVNYEWDAGTLTLTATVDGGARDGTLLFSLTLDDATSGEYTLTLHDNVLHDAGGDENDATAVLNFTVLDSDNSPAASTLTITFDDDAPTLDVTAGSDANAVLQTDDAQTIGDATDHAFSAVNFSGVFGLTFAAGADGAAAPTLSYTLDVTGFVLADPASDTAGVDSGLSQGGDTIYLYEIGGTVVGSTSATLGGVSETNTVFDVTVSATGVVTLNQYSQIDHPIADDPSPTVAPFTDDIASLVDELVTLTASASITDGDGDTVSDSETINIGANLRFTDDGPDAVNDSAGQVTENANVTIDVFANDTAGADGVDLVNGIAVVPGSLTGSGTLTYNDNGTFTYDPAPNENGPVSFSYEITDADGDTDTATVTITLQPDSNPQPVNATASVDDEGLAFGITGSTDGSDLVVPNTDGDNNEATFSGTLTANFGGDAPGTFSFAAMDGDTGTVGTESVEYNWDAGTNTLTATITSGARTGTDLFEVTVNPVNGNYSVTLLTNVLHSYDGTNTENDATAALTFTATDSEMESANGTLTITFDDDMPVAFDPDPISTGLENESGATASAELDVDGEIEDNVGADQPGTISFANIATVGDPDGTPSGLTSSDDPIEYWVSADGQTLEARTNSTDGTDGTLIFTIDLNQNPDPLGSDTYEVTILQPIDNGSGVAFENFDDAKAGNTNYVGIGADNENLPVDLLLSASKNTDADPAFEDNTVNTDSDSIGSQNQSMNPGEAVRIDFVSNLSSGAGTTTGFDFDSHVSSNTFLGFIPQVQGSEAQTVEFTVYALDTTLAATGTPDRDPSDGFSDSTITEITEVTVIGYDTGEETPVTVDISGADPGDTISVAYGISVTVNADGSVTFSGIQEGDQYGFGTGSGDFNAVVVEAHDEFDLGVFAIGTLDSGNPIELNFDLQLTDADGDTVVVDDALDITIVPASSAMEAPVTKGPAVQEMLVDKSALTVNDNFEQQLKSVNAANSNTVFLGAIAAAGIGATPAAAHSVFEPYGDVATIGGQTMLHSIAPQTDRMTVEQPAESMLAGKSATLVQDSGVASSNSMHSAPLDQANTLAGSDHGSAQAAPVEMPAGVDAPVQAAMADVAPVAMSVAMPSAEALALANASEATVDAKADVARVVADALAGGHEGPSIDALLDAATGHGGISVGALNDALGSGGGDVVPAGMIGDGWAAAVPTWDMGAFGGFTAGHSAFTMDAMAIHPDAAPITAA